jgi:hypothetical protein
MEQPARNAVGSLGDSGIIMDYMVGMSLLQDPGITFKIQNNQLVTQKTWFLFANG